MTKTFRPVFRLPAGVPELGDPAGVELLDEVQAPSTDDRATTAAVSHSDLFMKTVMLESFQLNL
jgi:hypothetical protein